MTDKYGHFVFDDLKELTAILQSMDMLVKSMNDEYAQADWAYYFGGEEITTEDAAVYYNDATGELSEIFEWFATIMKRYTKRY